MSRVVPLIRAAALFPLIRWMQASGRGVTERLAAADLGQVHLADPLRAVPMQGCVRLLDALTRDAPPDVGCRAVTPESVLEIAIISRVGLGAASPRDALTRISATMPYHCTHEQLTITTEGDAAVVRDRLSVPMAPATRHLAQQYVAMMIVQICALAGATGTPLRRVELVPHPARGVAHLVPWFGAGVVAGPGDTLRAVLPDAVADRAFPPDVRPGRPAAGPAVQPLRGDGSLAGSIRTILPGLFDPAAPTVDRVAGMAGMSRRTLQRLLAAEGTSFSQLVETVRREEALRRLSASGEPLAHVSSALGYAQQSALTRAVRRWTGAPPSRLRMDQTG